MPEQSHRACHPSVIILWSAGVMSPSKGSKSRFCRGSIL
jgi:hypothetical protein